MEIEIEELTQANFVRKLDNTTTPVVTDYYSNSDRLLVAFGGIKGFRAIPPLEFSRISHEMPTKKIFVRDFSQAWYQAGLPGITNSIAGIAQFLRNQIEEQGSKHVVMVGNSMGGYAALLFGAMLQADTAIAIAPQTYLTPWKRLFTLDFRWEPQVRRARKASQDRLHLDLRHFLALHPQNNHNLHVYHNGYFDNLHAANLRSLNVRIHHRNQGNHDLVRRMRETGELKEIILAALQA